MKIPSLTALTCQEVVELVAEYLRGEMSAADTACLEQHMHACTWCGVYVDQLRSTRRALGALAEPGADASSRARVLERFRRLKESP